MPRDRSSSRSRSRSRSSRASYDRSRSRSRSRQASDSRSERDSSVDSQGSNPLSALEKENLLLREDNKEVTLTLHKKSIKLYFDRMLATGELDKDARKALSERYFLSEKQFKTLAAPDLSSTRLHLIKDMDFSGLSSKLQAVHGKTRDVVKVLLAATETIGNTKKITDLYKVTAEDFSDSEGDSGRFVYSNFIHEALLDEQQALEHAENLVLQAYHKHTMKVLRTSHEAAMAAIDGLVDTFNLVFDSLQYAGQLDVAITKCRESKYEDFLQPSFKSELSARKDDKKNRLKSNALFSDNIDRRVSDHSKTNKKVISC